MESISLSSLKKTALESEFLIRGKVTKAIPKHVTFGGTTFSETDITCR